VLGIVEASNVADGRQQGHRRDQPDAGQLHQQRDALIGRGGLGDALFQPFLLTLGEFHCLPVARDIDALHVRPSQVTARSGRYSWSDGSGMAGGKRSTAAL
jgi:hypothetical protein